MDEITVLLATVKPCPFCGCDPEILWDEDSTHIEIQCCATMTRSKKSYLTVEQRNSQSRLTHRLSWENESVSLKGILSEWNERNEA